MDDGERRPDMWPTSGRVKVSDADILADMVGRLSVDEIPALTTDSIYAAFLEAKTANDAWIKYYLISVALLVMAAARAIDSLSLFGAGISGPFIGSAAILSFSVCALAYTNHELKMRLYRAFFKSRLDATNGPDRAKILLRFPLAFYGGEYLPLLARPKGFVVSWKYLLRSVPVLGILLICRLLALFGLGSLVVSALNEVLDDPTLPPLVKGAVLLSFVSSLAISGLMLRRAKVKHQYDA